MHGSTECGEIDAWLRYGSPIATRFACRVNANMLYTIAVILVVLWLLGLVSSYTMGGFVHILIVVAIVMILLRVISGRKVA